MTRVSAALENVQQVKTLLGEVELGYHTVGTAMATERVATDDEAAVEQMVCCLAFQDETAHCREG